jgi:actin-like ATPase involved in cell morphogenesis
LSAKLLSWVVASATERRGAPPDEVVLTYPANWGAYKRELIDQVIALADIGPTLTCPEPQAAAIQYAAQAPLQPGDRVAVYDLGGGTFDVCVLEKTEAGFTILGNPEGIEQLGGVDFDEAVFQHVVGALGPALEELELDSPEGRAALTRLRRDCVEAKEALSADVDTVIPVALPGRSTSVRLTRSELETLIEPALQETIDATARALRAADTTTGQLTAIVLVGGSSRIPLVSHLLQTRFSTPTALDTHPKHDVALGAVQFKGTSGATTSPTKPATVEAPPQQLAAVGGGGLRQLSGRAKRRLGLALGAVLVVVAGVVVTVQLASGDPSADNPAAVGPSSTPSTSARATTPTSVAPAGLRPLPAAPVPLSASELIVPMTAKAGTTGADLYLADATDPDKRTPVISAPGNDSLPALSPDRRTVIYAHSTQPGKAALWVAGVDGSGPRPLLQKIPAQCADGMSRPAWNIKDPTLLVVTCVKKPSTSGLYLMDTDGRVVRTLYSGSGEKHGVSDAAFSPDGTRIAYQTTRAPQTGTYVVAADGKSKPRQLTVGADADPAWSPVAPGVLAFRRGFGATAIVFVTSVDGKDVACAGRTRPNELGGGRMCQLTGGSSFDQDPSWSPTGEQIAVKHTDKAGTSIQIVPADGKAPPQPLWAGDPGPQNAPAWTSR